MIARGARACFFSDRLDNFIISHGVNRALLGTADIRVATDKERKQLGKERGGKIVNDTDEEGE